jgi:hypothetical protein
MNFFLQFSLKKLFDLILHYTLCCPIHYDTQGTCCHICLEFEECVTTFACVWDTHEHFMNGNSMQENLKM